MQILDKSIYMFNLESRALCRLMQNLIISFETFSDSGITT